MVEIILYIIRYMVDIIVDIDIISSMIDNINHMVEYSRSWIDIIWLILHYI